MHEHKRHLTVDLRKVTIYSDNKADLWSEIEYGTPLSTMHVIYREPSKKQK